MDSNYTPMHDKTPFITRFRSYRRKKVKSIGKGLMRWSANFLGQQSQVGDAAFFDPARFPFTTTLEENWVAIRNEAFEVLRKRDAIPAFHEVSPDQYRISTGSNWQTFVLYGFKQKLQKNCALCPQTTRVLEQIPDLQTAWFSIIAPHYHIPEHRGVTKGLLTCHLGVMVPAEKEKCRIRVENEVHHWEEGRSLVFDDSRRHEAWNDTDQDRVVLLIQFTRPMRPLGRLINGVFLSLIKLTAYYQEPKKNMARFEDRFQAAVQHAESYQIRDDD